MHTYCSVHMNIFSPPLLCYVALLLAILSFFEVCSPFAISDRNMLMFVHVPKAGGTTIEDSQLFIDAQSPSIGGHQSIQRHFNKRNMTFNQYLTAAVIRHPCERYLSAYFYMHSDLAWNGRDFATKHFRSWENPCTFINLMRRNGGPIEEFGVPHFIPAHKFLFLDNETFGIDELILFERYNEGLRKLEYALARHSNDTAFFDEGLYTGAHVLANPHPRCETLSEQCLDHIEEIYHIDYCVFGYMRNTSYIPPILSTEEYTRRMKAVCNNEQKEAHR